MACHYREAILSLFKYKVQYIDRAKNFDKREWELLQQNQPRPYQKEALETWVEFGSKGIVVLPTGAGKTYLALMAMAKIRRDTLVVTPTLDLLHQWVSTLEHAFGQKVGILGGGIHELQQITVATYDSAYIHMERLGCQFGFLIVDECHHMSGESYQWIAKMSIAPFRLGLTATPNSEENGYIDSSILLGPIVYQKEILDLKGHYLSDYRTERIHVPLEPSEKLEYQENRSIFTNYVKEKQIQFDKPSSWNDFLRYCFRTQEGKSVYEAYRKQKEILQTSDSKLKAIWKLLKKHRQERILIFTNDNLSAYKIGRLFMLPVLTHQTKVKERKIFLERFKSGTYPYLVTSKVLNEGVDLPQVNIGIVVSGSGSIREHVQRLGRILRKSKDKHAIMYELISENTAEVYQSKRRRMHSAYS